MQASVFAPGLEKDSRTLVRMSLGMLTLFCLSPLADELERFDEFGGPTRVEQASGVTVFTNEFWTARQRAASSLHEISYRACFKPQLPRFFIQRLTRPGDTVYIAPYSTQRITVLGPEDLEFLCIVDPAWREEDEEIL